MMPDLLNVVSGMVTCLHIWEASPSLVKKVQRVYFNQPLGGRDCFELGSELAIVLGGLGSLTAPQKVAGTLNLISKIGVATKKGVPLICDTKDLKTRQEQLICSMKVLELTTPILGATSLIAPSLCLDIASVVAHSLHASCRWSLELIDTEKLKKQNKIAGTIATAVTLADIVLPILMMLGIGQHELAKIGFPLTQKLSDGTVEDLIAIKNLCLRGEPQLIRAMVLWIPELSDASLKYVQCALKNLKNPQYHPERDPATGLAVAGAPSVHIRGTREQLEQEELAALRQGRPFPLSIVDAIALMPPTPSSAHVSRQIAQRSTGIADLSQMRLTPASIQDYCAQFDICIPEEFKNEDPFSDYICPITHRPIRYPVRFKDGMTLYERAALREFFHDHPDQIVPADGRADRRLEDVIDEERVGRAISARCEEIKRALRTLLPTLIG